MATAVRYESQSGVGQITLSGPHGGNALAPSTVDELHAALTRAQTGEVNRAIVLVAEGDDFCTGLDLGALSGQDPASVMPVFRKFADCLLMLCTSPIPTLAGVRGRAAGGGMGLACACDLVVSQRGARFQLPEVTIGLIPALVAPVLLRRTSTARVRSLAIGSRAMPVEDVACAGLVDVVADDLDAVVCHQVRRLLRSSPRALTATKRYLDALDGRDLSAQMERALREVDDWLSQPAVMEDIRLFAEGDIPSWFSREA